MFGRILDLDWILEYVKTVRTIISVLPNLMDKVLLRLKKDMRKLNCGSVFCQLKIILPKILLLDGRAVGEKTVILVAFVVGAIEVQTCGGQCVTQVTRKRMIPIIADNASMDSELQWEHMVYLIRVAHWMKS